MLGKRLVSSYHVVLSWSCLSCFSFRYHIHFSKKLVRCVQLSFVCQFCCCHFRSLTLHDKLFNLLDSLSQMLTFVLCRWHLPQACWHQVWQLPLIRYRFIARMLSTRAYKEDISATVIIINQGRPSPKPVMHFPLLTDSPLFKIFHNIFTVLEKFPRFFQQI